MRGKPRLACPACVVFSQTQNHNHGIDIRILACLSKAAPIFEILEEWPEQRS